ncbi:MAG TPA: hypothetical protein VGO34_03785 [Alphaproteobacteria bacterium]|jgi:hypothetical protein
MSSNLKMALLAGAAGIAMATGFAAAPANAFDRTYWTFKLDIEPCVDINVNLDPDSLTTVEVEQSSIGDISAISVVKNISIAQPEVGGGDYGHGNSHGNSHGNDHGNNNNDPVPPMDALTELGQIVSTATAVANNVNVDAFTEGLFADISQSASGGYHSSGTVLAKSKVVDIDDLMVDSSATAVSNNINLSIDPGSVIANTSIVANLSQTSNMDVTAKSIVKNVTLTNFSGLGSLTSPVISSVATAVGNNVNVGVTVPTP